MGVVGRNGCGKSSLFAVVQGDLDPDRGDMELSGRVRIASVAQETPHLPDPAIDFVMSGDAPVWAAIKAERDAMAAEDYEAVAVAHQRLAELQAYDAEARAGRLLHGLGFPGGHPRQARGRILRRLARAPEPGPGADDAVGPAAARRAHQPPGPRRRALARGLAAEVPRHAPDDFPRPGVPRRRHQPHAAPATTARAKLYTGDYTAFERQRAEHLRLQQIAFEKEQAEREHLQKFIARFKAKASKAKQAQSRMKRLAKLAGTEAVRAEHALHISFDAPPKLPFSLIRLNHVDAGYRAAAPREGDEHLPGEPSSERGDVAILANVSFGLEAGDRVALLGPNGAGKSTLVKTLVGELPVLAGERNVHNDLRIGYFAQHTVESLRVRRYARWTISGTSRPRPPPRTCAASSAAGISPASGRSRPWTSSRAASGPAWRWR